MSCPQSPVVPTVTDMDHVFDKKLNQGLGLVDYDPSCSQWWEDVWGVHMHHGFYDPDEQVPRSISDHQAAQLRMIQEVLRFAGVSEDPGKRPKNVVDVGCGAGGATMYIARTYGAKCKGITIIPYQAQKANATAASEGFADKVSFQVADALEQPFSDGEFDLVWSMECVEQIPDKRKFVSEMARVAAPGATIVIATLCHRNLGSSEKSLQPWEKEHLKKIRGPNPVPDYCSTADYVKLFESLSLEYIKTADFTQSAAPFMSAVIPSLFTWKALSALLRGGVQAIKGAWVTSSGTSLLIEGYKKGLIRYGVIAGRKPK